MVDDAVGCRGQHITVGSSARGSRVAQESGGTTAVELESGDDPRGSARGGARESCQASQGRPLGVPSAGGPLVTRDHGTRHDFEQPGRLHCCGRDHDGVDGVLLVGHRR